ncbi:MJ1255/VC2487 family glycosyltransferase [Shewanella sp. GutDb-MelDb]|uniref:MJ1255/VC2487 family glycosyltransferase n=1 Tax=Shewanella sp. GutDb-MelDb TaxID=2058316 RepID=UPI000C79B320|nr:MJ1255/VC2487 family glycosyltransferase [Shewanella sp. GutDb-MelDb]PKG55779.1 glycosyltransferase [Shewanella sp. GutDb-MelDb]
MKILYGVQGTGNGHLSRARVMAKAMHKQGVDVDFFFSGRSSEQFFDMQCFGQYRVQSGLTFATKDGRVNVGQTAKMNAWFGFVKDVKNLDLSGYDLVLNDFEPVSAWAAKNQGVPSIGISHQAALNFSVPKVGDNWFNETMLNYFAPVDIALGCHWHHFGFPILPPFVEVDKVEKELAHQVLVYLPFESPDAIVDFLAPFTDYTFLVYHAGITHQSMPSHIKWHGFDRDGFKAAMASCGGVIGNAGFELASEALTLGKKLLIKPLLGQFEQLSNVAALELLGAAECMKTCLEPDALRRWLKSPTPESIDYPQVADELVSWLLKGDWNQPEELCQSLWSQVNLPQSWQKKSP